MALSADTLLHTLQGDVPLKKLAARGDPVHGFCWDGKKIGAVVLRIGEARTAEIIRVVLDNGRSFFCTPDTTFADFDTKEEVPAAERQRVLPLYLKDQNGRPHFKQMRADRQAGSTSADRRTFRSVARMVYEWGYGVQLLPGVAVRHRDGDQRNCLPNNLYLYGKPITKKANKFTRLRDLQQSLITNHRIIGFEEFGADEVYDVEPESPIFFAAGEVFVKGGNGSS